MMRGEKERDHSDLDQASSDVDQIAADVDQGASESDQAKSNRDQDASDRDQSAADMDESGIEPDAEASDGSRYVKTREMRQESRGERREATLARAHSAVSRDTVASQRDETSRARDLVSAARDELAARLDDEIERLEGERETDRERPPDGSIHRSRAAHERLAAVSARARAAAQRAASADDRARAAQDRELAALDRVVYHEELASAEMDEVTGALRRRVGLAALRREMDRTRRSGEQLTVVFIDVDGLKRTNDERGHAAGDTLLRAVVGSVSEEFRSYDLIFRVGGDEFVCSLAGDGLEGIGKRFERVNTRLREAMPGASISTGVSERVPEDTAETLIDRADREMIAGRRSHSARGGRSG